MHLQLTAEILVMSCYSKEKMRELYMCVFKTGNAENSVVSIVSNYVSFFLKAINQFLPDLFWMRQLFSFSVVVIPEFRCAKLGGNSMECLIL